MHCDPNNKYERQFLLERAALRGEIDTVIALAPLVEDRTGPLFSASKKGHLDCVVALLDNNLDNKIPHDVVWGAAMLAVQHNQIAVLKHLIGHCDVGWEGSALLQDAVAEQHWEMVDLLYPLSNPIEALHAMQNNWFNNSDKWAPLEQRIACEQQQERLTDVVNGVHIQSAPTVQRKI